jgi:hypothetical protein
MTSDKHLSIRLTDERQNNIERLRQLLQQSGRNVETIHGVVTTAAVIDEALKALADDLGAPLEEDDEKVDVEANFLRGWHEAMTGKVHPYETLWDRVDDRREPRSDGK